jgi:serine/threonine-protein kinase
VSDGVAAPTPRLLLFGGIALSGVADDVGHAILSQPKAVALLAYLALSPVGRFQRRDLLAALFWPELDQSHARGALRKLVFVVRSALGPDSILSRGDEELALSSDALSCDVREFTASADAGQLANALDLYHVELMPGFHIAGCADLDAWLDEQRAVARERAFAAAWALAQRLEGEENLTEAGQWARRAVRYKGDDERVLRRAVQMLDRLGDRAGALRLYDDFARQLRRSLDLEPSAETQALIAAIRRS